MGVSQLKVAAKDNEIYVVGKGGESRAERIRRMQETARSLAREEIEDMLQALNKVAAMAEQIATGGDAYAVGIREMSGRLQADLTSQSKAIEALLRRL